MDILEAAFAGASQVGEILEAFLGLAPWVYAFLVIDLLIVALGVIVRMRRGSK